MSDALRGRPELEEGDADENEAKDKLNLMQHYGSWSATARVYFAVGVVWVLLEPNSTTGATSHGSCLETRGKGDSGSDIPVSEKANKTKWKGPRLDYVNKRGDSRTDKGAEAHPQGWGPGLSCTIS